jgi:hypothetical protein
VPTFAFALYHKSRALATNERLKTPHVMNAQPAWSATCAAAALPTFAWAHASSGAKSSVTPESPGAPLPQPACAICTEDLEEGCRVTCMPCGHLFHAACLTPWLRQHNTCPMCRFRLPADDPVTDRVRPASSAPARPTGEGRRSLRLRSHDPRPHGEGDVSVPGEGEEEGGARREPGAPVLWTSMHRPASASNPATWSIGKLQGVLEAGGVSYQHCNDRSSLVEMVVMCLRDYAGAGARYDLEQLRSLHLLPTARTGHNAQHGASCFLSDDSDEDSLDARGASGYDMPVGCLASGHASADAAAGRPARGHGHWGSSAERGCEGGEAGGASVHACTAPRRDRSALARGSMQEVLHLARNGQVEELSRAMLMASAARSTRTRAAEILNERERAAELERLSHFAHRERQRAQESQTLALACARQRERQRHTRDSDAAESSQDLFSPPPPPEKEHGMRVRPALEEAGAPVWVGMNIRDGDFGWCDGGGSRGTGVGLGVGAGGGAQDVREEGANSVRIECVNSLPRRCLADVHLKSRSLVMKVAAGKDRSVFE